MRTSNLTSDDDDDSVDVALKYSREICNKEYIHKTRFQVAKVIRI
jgi:hypothetical protein